MAKCGLHTGLLSLPNELLVTVAGHFAASPDKMDLPRAGAVCTRSTDYNSLLSLSSTSRRFAAVNRPLIYRVVELTDIKGMLLLIRTLLGHRDLRHLVLHLSIGCVVRKKISDEDGLQDMIAACATYLNSIKSLDGQDQRMLGYFKIGERSTVCIEGIHYGGVLGGFLAALLCLTPSVETLRFLANGRWDPRQWRRDAEQDPLDTMKVMVKDLISWLEPQPMSKIRRLQLICCKPNTTVTQDRFSDCSIPMRVFSSLCPTLQVIETFGDNGWWITPSTSNSFSAPGKILEVAALNSHSLGQNVAGIGRNFRGLQKLTIRVTEKPLYGQVDIERGLLGLADSLEYLHIELPWDKPFIEQLGRDSRLECLHKMNRLRHLHVQLGALCPQAMPLIEGPVSKSGSQLGDYSLAVDLPPSLESLELVETLQMAYKDLDDGMGVTVRRWLRHEYDHALMNMILEFCTQASSTQPCLRYFCLLAARETEVLKKHVPVIKDVCAAQSIVAEVEVPGFGKRKNVRHLL
ncbi:uncharacterized protein JN550_012363 [Neoarthrinium moseri]|uniref:uncharacterized protein n=1 Tax=Neoarthrinium moseri TaxID=1658444 RepID=UPI001FDBB43D|nr:uncharacterized protein JN550_012363 [Neoarthrinium moseri]KAI1858904.1 hypothetical protein JN550_012363 [Neoarthrinium moseri]